MSHHSGALRAVPVESNVVRINHESLGRNFFGRTIAVVQLKDAPTFAAKEVVVMPLSSLVPGRLSGDGDNRCLAGIDEAGERAIDRGNADAGRFVQSATMDFLRRERTFGMSKRVCDGLLLSSATALDEFAGEGSCHLIEIKLSISSAQTQKTFHSI